MEQYITNSRGRFEEQLEALVNIPSVSADVAHADDVHRCAQLGAELLRGIGAKAEVVPTDGYPVVLGEIVNDPRYPTLTVYNHLDVQPAEASEWTHQAPFTFRREGERYEGRGATDDKGPALTALFAARFAKETGIPLNFKFIWELEEEVGSPHFSQFIKSQRARLNTDSVVVSDTIWIARDRPAVPYGLRGLQTFLFTLHTHAKDVHSGLTGGVARNPIGELCQLVADCYDARTGRVKIPGFYDDVRPVTRGDLASFLQSGFRASRYQKAHELATIRPHLKTEADLMKAIMAQPTFEVHGIVGGYAGPGVKTIVPHRGEVKISTRLVPDQRPSKIACLVKAFAKKKNPDVRVLATQQLEPFLGPQSGPYADAARTAMKSAFGREPAFVREGGSIGAVVTMQKALKVPIVFLGLSLPEHGYHAPNENFDWKQASGGMAMFVRYFKEVAQIVKPVVKTVASRRKTGKLTTAKIA
jgi:acetylornithine deacetylase/succinyl-diaminopimelate desuccinylase-like protein